MPEMLTFFALQLYMGVVRYPTIKCYWSREFLFAGPKIFCAEVMSRNRFLGILKFIRFSHPSAYVPGRPITRLGVFFSMLRQNCMTIVDPGEVVALDECLVLYKGRLHFKQFIKTKRARFGLKLFRVCPSDPALRGYTYNFALYFGKDIYKIYNIPESLQLSLSERIVVYLAQNLLCEGREIILDNWYMSLRLAEFLLSKNTYVTGTIRFNRGVPKELTETQLERFQACFVRKGDILVVRYKDKRDVYLLSTKLTAGFTEKSRYQSKVSATVSIQKPLAIEHYNLNMGAVDAVDQDLEPYNCTRKSYTWFKKIGFHMVQRMVLNSKVLYINATGTQINVLDYTKTLIDDLLSENSPGYKKLKAEYKNNQEQKRGNVPSVKHVFACHKKEEGFRRKRGTCRVCYQTEKKRTYTSNFCGNCGSGPIYLCSIEHFNEYHK